MFFLISGSRFIEKKTRREGYSTYDESLFDKNREYLIRTSLHLPITRFYIL